MNPWDLSSSELMVWGLVLHLIADWLFQNEWMALHKMERRGGYNPTTMTGAKGTKYTRPWWDRHPACYVHSGVHLAFLSLIFGWVAIPLALAHVFIDLRFPVVWWSMFIKQTQPLGKRFDIGTDVRIWTDQVFHIVCVAVAALIVGAR